MPKCLFCRQELTGDYPSCTDEPLESAAKLRKAACAVATHRWGTSVSEAEHFDRMYDMDILRRVLREIEQAERALLAGGK